MNKSIIGIVILVILGVGGYFVYLNYANPKNDYLLNSGTPSASSQDAALAQIEINSFKFNPSRLTVKAGAEVTLVNRDSANHSLTSDQEGLFNTDLIGKNASKTFKAPLVVGEYPFHCAAHPSMAGVLVVEE